MVKKLLIKNSQHLTKQQSPANNKKIIKVLCVLDLDGKRIRRKFAGKISGEKKALTFLFQL